MRSLSRYRRTRSAFTLVELLVSITIFVILATLTISAFRDSKHDKVASAARQVTASINGARSRAVKAGEPRGIRLIRDPNDPWLITGVQYIGSGQVTNGSARVQINQRGDVRLRLPAAQTGVWNDLSNLGLFKAGARIRIPADETGRWYTVATNGFSPATDTIEIVGKLERSQWSDAAQPLPRYAPNPFIYSPQRNYFHIEDNIDPQLIVPNTAAFQGTPDEDANNNGTMEPGEDVNSNGFLDRWTNTVPIAYLLRLNTQELPDTEPISFPPGIVIDLLASQFPNSWKAFEDVNQNGLLDASENDGNVFSGNAYPDDDADGVLDEVNFDIPISPSGAVVGPLLGSGPIILCVCARDDIDRKQALAGYDPATTGFRRAGGTFRTPQVPGDFENYSDPNSAAYNAEAPSSERKLVTLIPQTGLVYVADVLGTDADTNGWADTPFTYARTGRERP